MDELKERLIQNIDEEIEGLIEQAERIVSAHWDWVDTANRSLKSARQQATKSGDKDDVLKKRYSNVGPRIEKVTAGVSSNAYVRRKINWVVFPNEAIRRVPGKTKSGVKFSQFSKRVRPTNNSEYRLSTLAKISAGWDAQKIIETEKLLMPIREQIEALHKARVTINKAPKRIHRIAKKYEEYSHA